MSFESESMVSSHARRVLLLINPSARLSSSQGSDLYTEAVDRLERLGLRVIKYPNAKPEEFVEIIRHNARRVDAVILGGGDGTVRTALRAIVPAKLLFGVLPLGTANNLARSLGIPADLESAFTVIGQWRSRAIDLGVVNGEYFLNVAGMGLSTQVNQHVPHHLKRRFGMLAYIWYAWKVIRRFKPFSARITANGETRVVRTMQITVCNGRHYGAGLTITEDASIDDGRLDLCSTEIRHWWQGLKLIPAILKARYEERRELRLIQGQEIQIETRKPLRIDTDGEITVKTPATFRVFAGALRVFAPVEAQIQTGPRVATGTSPAPLDLSL